MPWFLPNRYMSAGYSGRMPCCHLGDAVVETGRDILTFTINYIQQSIHNAEVVYPCFLTSLFTRYGDTDSIFVKLNGYTVQQAYDMGNYIAGILWTNTAICRHYYKLLSLSYSVKVWEGLLSLHHDFQEALLWNVLYKTGCKAIVLWVLAVSVCSVHSKGIETVRRDQCLYVQKILTNILSSLFTFKNLSFVKEYSFSSFAYH